MGTEFVAGCLGGCAGVAVGHPLDTIKVRLQTQDGLNPRYRGTWDCFRQTLQAESVRGLYKGMSSPLVGVSLVNAIIFGVHGNIMKNLKDKISITSHAIAGAGAGLVQAFIASPMELAKTRMQIQSTTAPAYKNPLQCLRGIFATEGLRGIFRGQVITLMREVPGFATYFGSYEYLLNNFTKKEEDPSGPAIMMAGGLAGIFSWVITYPIDVVKSRMQADGAEGENKYRGICHCLRSSIANEGASVLTRGITSTIIRAFPTNAATFMVVSLVVDLSEKTDISYGDSAAWRDVISRGEVLVAAATDPITSRVCPAIEKQRQYLFCLQEVIRSAFILKYYSLEPERGRFNNIIYHISTQYTD